MSDHLSAADVCHVTIGLKHLCLEPSVPYYSYNMNIKI